MCRRFTPYSPPLSTYVSTRKRELMEPPKPPNDGRGRIFVTGSQQAYTITCIHIPCNQSRKNISIEKVFPNPKRTNYSELYNSCFFMSI